MIELVKHLCRSDFAFIFHYKHTAREPNDVTQYSRARFLNFENVLIFWMPCGKGIGKCISKYIIFRKTHSDLNSFIFIFRANPIYYLWWNLTVLPFFSSFQKMYAQFIYSSKQTLFTLKVNYANIIVYCWQHLNSNLKTHRSWPLKCNVKRCLQHCKIRHWCKQNNNNNRMFLLRNWTRDDVFVMKLVIVYNMHDLIVYKHTTEINIDKSKQMTNHYCYCRKMKNQVVVFITMTFKRNQFHCLQTLKISKSNKIHCLRNRILDRSWQVDTKQ